MTPFYFWTVGLLLLSMNLYGWIVFANHTETLSAMPVAIRRIVTWPLALPLPMIFVLVASPQVVAVPLVIGSFLAIANSCRILSSHPRA